MGADGHLSYLDHLEVDHDEFALTCRVTCTPLLDRDKTLRGVIVVVADDPGQQAPVAPVL